MIKGTGIIRRIDDLGRIAIPKEIRRKLEIKEGQPMEISFDQEGRIILQKYYEQQESLKSFADSNKCSNDDLDCIDSDFYNKSTNKNAIEFIWHAEITQEYYEKESLKNIYDWLLSIAKQDAEKQKYEIIDNKINASFDFQKDKKLVFITVTQNVKF